MIAWDKSFAVPQDQRMKAERIGYISRESPSIKRKIDTRQALNQRQELASPRVKVNGSNL